MVEIAVLDGTHHFLALRDAGRDFLSGLRGPLANAVSRAPSCPNMQWDAGEGGAMALTARLDF